MSHLKPEQVVTVAQSSANATAKSYSQGYEDGYEAGYNEATEHWQEDCRQLRAILDKGETPEDSGSKADRG